MLFSSGHKNDAATKLLSPLELGTKLDSGFNFRTWNQEVSNLGYLRTVLKLVEPSISRGSSVPSFIKKFNQEVEIILTKFYEKNSMLNVEYEEDSLSSKNDHNMLLKCVSLKIESYFFGFVILIINFIRPDTSPHRWKEKVKEYIGCLIQYWRRLGWFNIWCESLLNVVISNYETFIIGMQVKKCHWIVNVLVAKETFNWRNYQLELMNKKHILQSLYSAFRSVYLHPARVNSLSLVWNKSISVLKQGTKKMSNIRSQKILWRKIKLESYNHPFIFQIMYNLEKKLIVFHLISFASHMRCTVPECVAVSFKKQSTKKPLPKVTNQNVNPTPKRVQLQTVDNTQHSSCHVQATIKNKRERRRANDYALCLYYYLMSWSKLSNSIYLNFGNIFSQDCFFVSVVIKNRPELWDKPVAVCHSDNPRGTAEISSANYPARDHGVKAGIFVRHAKALCPHLVILPYDFEAYEEVADQLYDILHKHCDKVQAVSCDEAFIDVTDSDLEDPQLLASIIRKEIFDTTGCTASAGIAGNMLMARLATRTAKPDGQCYIHPEKVDDYLHELPIKALPGIGHALEEKLKTRQVKTCGQLRTISKESLRKDFGSKTGDMLWNYSRGIDNRMVGVIQESKSVGAEVNWGVRFNDLKDSQHFLVNLCKEVSLRLQGCGVQGRTFTLKVKKRRNDAGEPVKYMGCGDCENFSHSITVPVATDDVDVLQRITTQLFGSFHIDVKDIRGMGLQVSKLETADNAHQGHKWNSIRSWLVSASASNREQCKISSPAKESANKGFKEQSNDRNLGGQLFSEAVSNQDSTLPPLCDLDMGVIASLPPELYSEINDMYGGKLASLISKNKGKSVVIGSLCSASSESFDGLKNEGKGPLLTHLAPSREINIDKKTTGSSTSSVPRASKRPMGHLRGNQFTTAGKDQAAQVSGAKTSNPGNSASFPESIDLVMPSSLSQVDVSVLQQLPEEVKVDILELLPAHRIPECTPNAVSIPSTSYPKESLCVKQNDNPPRLSDAIRSSDLWVGNPPRWVDEFEKSNYWILNIFAEMYYRSGSTAQLSYILLRTMSVSQLPVGASAEGWDEAINCFCELLKQYVKLKIETDIEEVYDCFCLLKRYVPKSKRHHHGGLL
ncbi:hypothetical protein LguiA_027348 [Lonicera macranthoides]